MPRKQSAEKRRQLAKIAARERREKAKKQSGAIDQNVNETQLARPSKAELELKKEVMRKLRSNEYYKATENAINNERIKTLRNNDPEYLTKENIANIQRIRSVRSTDHEYKNRELVMNIQRIQTLRATDDEYSTRENVINKRRIQKLRNTNSEYKEQEAQRNRIAMKRARENEEYTATEKLRKSLAKRQKREIELMQDCLETILNEEEIHMNEAQRSFREQCKEGPTAICPCCDRLWFPRSCIKIIRATIAKKHGDNLWQQIFSDNDESKIVCSSCKDSIEQQGKVPKYCKINYNIVFPIPAELKGLSVLEERLVSPRLPFMQIRALGYNRQCSIKGQIVNVPISVDNTVKALPRNVDDTCTIQLKLKRKMCYNKDYLCETIRPKKVVVAAEYLVKQPLYQQLGITMSNQAWNNSTPTAAVQDTDDDEENEMYPSLNRAMNAILDEFEQDDVFAEAVNPGAEETLLDNTDLENIALAPGENATPLHLMNDQYADELSFPTVFCGNKRTFNVKYSYSDIVKVQAKHSDRRFARTNLLLYMYKKETLIHIVENINVAVRQKIGQPSYTAGDVQSSEFANRLEQYDAGYNFLQKINASPSHWQMEKRKVLSMIRQFNIPTLFITISAAETMWPELLVILSSVVDKKHLTEEEALQLPYGEKSRLIRTDPVTCAQYFNNRFKLLLKYMKSDQGPFKEHPIEHFYYRVEFQHRGSPHVHGLFWLKGAPLCDFANIAKVKECELFIRKYITCDSSLNSVKDLIAYQTHHHTKSCKKEYREVVSCRYGIPFLPSDEATILIPYDHKPQNGENNSKQILGKIKKFLNENKDSDISFEEFLTTFSLTKEAYHMVIRRNITKPMILIKRRIKDCFINSFNEDLFVMMRSNMDIQFILDPYACCSYIINYINKSDRGVSRLMREAMQEIRKGNMEVKQQLRKLGTVFMNASEVSAQEAAYSVLKLGMSGASTQEIYINTKTPDKRVRVLKTRKELAALPQDSTDIYQQNLIDHYVIRPNELEALCLAEFAAFYTYVKCKPNQEPKVNKLYLKDNSYELSKRQRPKVLSFYVRGLQHDSISFYRQNLMLYLPWRDEATELLNVDQEQVYLTFFETIKENRAKFDVLNTVLLDDAFELAKRNLEEILLDDDQNELDPEYGPFAGGPSQNDILKGIDDDQNPGSKQTFPTPLQMDNSEYDALISQLNERQYEYLTHVLENVKRGKKVYEIISGGAGVGKSCLISAIFQTLLRHFNSTPGNNPESVKVLLAAFTGKASFNIGGTTLHSAFALPVNQYGESLIPLSRERVVSLHSKLIDMKLVIIDEYSMVGAKMFDYLNSRLQQIFKSKEDFGGISIILVGDLQQLPPVGDRWIFMPKNNGPFSEITGRYLWDKFAFFELTEIMRQRDDKKFAEALNHVAVGQMTDEDIKLFCSRVVRNPSTAMMPETTIHLFRSNKDVDSFNDSRLSQFNTERAVCDAVDRIKGSCPERVKQKLLLQASKLKKAESFGLILKLILQIGAKYMMSVNVNTGDGLVNGATGILRKICKDQNDKPIRVWVEFDDLKVGLQTRTKFKTLMVLDNIPLHWTPVEKTSRAINFQKGTSVTVERKQFPLLVSEGITIHKSQGSTYRNVAVHLTVGLPRNSLYVACSRCTSLDGLFLFGSFKPPSKPTKADRSYLELEHLRANKVLTTDFRKHYFAENTDASSKLTIAYHNIQSFRKNSKFMKNNPLFIHSDLIVLVETWANGTDDIEIKDFECFANLYDTSSSARKPFGILCYKRTTLNVELIEIIKEIHNFRVFQAVVFEVENRMTVVCVYIPPNFGISAAKSVVEKILSKVDNDCCILGDFNMDLSTGDGNSLVDFLLARDFKSSMNVRRIWTTKMRTHIDWCFSTCEKRVKSHVFQTVYSHHNAIAINMFSEDQVNEIVDSPVQVESIGNNDVSRLLLVQSPDLLDLSSGSDDERGISIASHESLVNASTFQHEGLDNMDSVSCYANASMQCLFSMEEFRTSVWKRNSSINRQIYLVLLRDIENTVFVRAEVDEQFNRDEQQDVHEFLMSLFQKLDADFLQHVTFTTADWTNCSSCDASGTTEENSNFFLMNIPDCESVSFRELCSNQLRDRTRHACHNCQAETLIRGKTLRLVPKYLFLVFLRFTYCPETSAALKVSTTVSDLDPENITFDGHQFRLKSVIKHVGDSIYRGHYVVIIRDGSSSNWIECNDREITHVRNFDSSLKDVYVAVLEKVCIIQAEDVLEFEAHPLSMELFWNQDGHTTSQRCDET